MNLRASVTDLTGLWDIDIDLSMRLCIVCISSCIYYYIFCMYINIYIIRIFYSIIFLLLFFTDLLDQHARTVVVLALDISIN
jgi:hypothetical protein